MSLFLAVPAQAEPEQTPLPDVISKLGVESPPTDYVVLVDTSASMTAQGRYDKVKAALTSMVGTLLPTDHLTLITFDTTAVTRFNALVGAAPGDALATLPDQPTGRDTDIGAGIDAALGALEAESPRHLAALALITDGKVDAPGSPYDDPSSPAWAMLKTRATAAVQKRPIAGYALGLITATDAALLHNVLADTTDIAADQFSSRLGALRHELLRFQATEALKPDASAAVTARWTGTTWPTGADGGVVKASITLTSTAKAVPLVVSGLRLSQTSGASMTAPPASVQLAPGASVEVPVTVTIPELKPDATLSLTPTADVSSPWSDAYASAVGTPLNPRLEGAAVGLQASAAPAAAAPVGSSPMATPALALAGIGGLLVAAVLAFVALRLRRPRLSGSLTIEAEARVVREFILSGRGMPLADPKTPGLVGQISTRARNNATPYVSIRARSGTEKARTALADGESMQIGPYRIIFTAPHSRSIALISAGLAEPLNRE